MQIPEAVKIEMSDGKIRVLGKTTLELKMPEQVDINQKDGQLWVTTSANKTNLQGVVRAVIQNMVLGVTEGFTKVLEISGTGYRASSSGTELNLSLGFSHPIKITAPAGISFEVKENKIKVMGADKQAVGEAAAKIRRLKPADVYKHKGLKYEGEKLIKKAGKAAKAGAPGAK